MADRRLSLPGRVHVWDSDGLEINPAYLEVFVEGISDQPSEYF